MSVARCREGHCGCCETAVLKGEVDHRDNYLFREDRGIEKKMMMIWVSLRRSSRSVFDL